MMVGCRVSVSKIYRHIVASSDMLVLRWETMTVGCWVSVCRISLHILVPCLMFVLK